jgi:hypothetical protein
VGVRVGGARNAGVRSGAKKAAGGGVSGVAGEGACASAGGRGAGGAAGGGGGEGEEEWNVYNHLQSESEDVYKVNRHNAKRADVVLEDEYSRIRN